MPPTQKKSRGRPSLEDERRLEVEVRRRGDGARLRGALQRLGISQAEAARQCGIKQQYLNAVVNGERDLGREDLRKLSSKLSVSADFLLGRSDVEADVTKRSTIGPLADELRVLLSTRAPEGADFGELDMLPSGLPAATEDPERLVGEVAAVWWSSRLRARKEELGRLYRELARRTREDMRGLPAPDCEHLKSAEDDYIHHFLETAAVVESAATRWNEIVPSSKASPFTIVSIAYECRDGMTRPVGYVMLETPFKAVGEAGAGYGFSGATGDYAWYIDPDTRTVTFKGGPGVRFEGFRRRHRIWDDDLSSEPRPEGPDQPEIFGFRQLPRGVKAHWIEAPEEWFDGD